MLRRALILGIFTLASEAMGLTHEPWTMDPFDLAGGGAVLTWSTQNDIPAANPALLCLGRKNFRWMGLRTSFYPGAQSVDLVRSMAKDSSALQKKTPQEFIDLVFDNPLHLGLSEVMSFITRHFGLALFANTQPDIKIWRNGDPARGAGTPKLIFNNEAYGGALASVAGQLSSFLSLGLTAKYLMITQGAVDIDVTDQAAASSAKEQFQSQNLSNPAKAYGMDAGLLLFRTGDFLDLRLGATLANITPMKLSAPVENAPTLRAYNVGVGLTLHSYADAIHISADYRDLTNAYQEPLFKRVYVGSKIVIRRVLGLATGIYQGSPSYGVELDLFLLKLSLAQYTREYGDHIGVDPRRIYVVSLALGTYF